MTTTRLALFSLFWLSVVGVTLSLGQSSVPNLAGDYQIVGETHRGPYAGIASVAQKDRAVFFRWQSPSGESLQGFGLIAGNVVAVAYAADDVGIAVLYRIEDDRLIGEWPGVDGTIWPETLTKEPARIQAQR